MIYLLPLQKVISAIAVCYAFLVMALSAAFEFVGWGSVTIALRGAVVVELLVLGFAVFGWRRAWRKWPALGKWLYPDLNGQWKVDIHWNRGTENGVKGAMATIKQDFFRLSMDLESNESESETLIVKAKKSPESSRPVLYYIYRNESAQGVSNPQPPHNGAAILKLDLHDDNCLKGNYFTDRATSGHFQLIRVQQD